MNKALKAAALKAIDASKWKKFTSPTVIRGKTVFPKTEADKEKLGVRWDYDGEIKGSDGATYHKFQMQPNAGAKIPTAIKQWREKNGGTHAVMANVLVKKDGTKEDVQTSLEKAIEQVKSK